MNTSKLLASAIAAASIVGGVGFAYAQTTPATPNDTTAQSRPADQGMTTNQPAGVTVQPGAQSNTPSTQPVEPMQRPGVQTPSQQPMPQGSPDSATPYTPSTATDNTTVPSTRTAPGSTGNGAMPGTTPMNTDSGAMPAGSERAPQADRN